MANLGVGARVLMPGFSSIRDCRCIFGLVQTLILASTTELWGMVVNGAMPSGLPLLLS
jgi:1,2-diacylglycerol 3-alpha-glucosyltransferase